MLERSKRSGTVMNARKFQNSFHIAFFACCREIFDPTMKPLQGKEKTTSIDKLILYNFTLEMPMDKLVMNQIGIVKHVQICSKSNQLKTSEDTAFEAFTLD